MLGLFKILKKEKQEDFTSFRAIVNTHISNLNIRSNASKLYRPITTAPKGTRLLVYGEEGDWYKIVYRGLKGYAFKEYVLPLDTKLNNTNQ